MSASIRSKVTDKAIAVSMQGDTLVRPSKIPSFLRFPLLVTLSLTLSSLLYSFSADYTSGDLARVSRRLDQWWQVGALLGWRTFELAVGWYGNYDGYDLASLSLLSHGPPLYLLASFYEVSPAAVITSLVIDSLTTYIPFRLLRPLSLAHSASNSKYSIPVPNSEIITSTDIQVYTTLLAAVIYAVTLSISYTAFLPIYLVTYFEGIPTIAAAHSPSWIGILPVTLLLGLAAKSFIFTPAVTVSPSLADAKKSAFNPATATLEETLWHNVGFGPRTRVVANRTASLMFVTGVNTFIQTFVTIEGVEATGAAVYSAVWVVAAGISGTALGFVAAA